MHILAITNFYPSPEQPHIQGWVATQVESLRAAGVDVDVMHVDRVNEGRKAYRGLALRIEQECARSAPDLVHVMYGGVMAEIATRSSGRTPVLISFCGDDLHGGFGGSVVERLGRRYGVMASHRAARRADGIVVKSQNLYDALPSELDPERVWILPNGVDLTSYFPRDQSLCREELGWDHAAVHVLFPADPANPLKRFALVEAAVESLASRGRRVELHALNGVANADVPLWMNAADVVVLASVREGSPNVVKEALACNVPVVSVDVGDVRERLAGIVGCYLTEPTPHELAAHIDQVLGAGTRIDAGARAAELSLDRVAERLVEIYGRLLERPAPGRRPS